MNPIIMTAICMLTCVRLDVVRSIRRGDIFTSGGYKVEVERQSGSIATVLDPIQITDHAVTDDKTVSSLVFSTEVSVMNTDARIGIPITGTGNEVATTDRSMRDAAGTSVDNAVERLITAMRTTVESYVNPDRPPGDGTHGDITDGRRINDDARATVSEPDDLDANDRESTGSEHAANAGCSNQIVPRARNEVVLKTSFIEWILVIIAAFFLIIAFSFVYLIGYIRDRRRNRMVRFDSEVTLWDATENQ